MELDFEVVSQEINPQFAQIADENDLVIFTRFDSEGNSDANGFIDLVYPYASLKPVRELLRNRVQTGDGNEDSEKQWHKDLAMAVDNAALEIQILMGGIESSFGEIENMQAGDLLYFKKPDHAKLLINGIPAFEAQVGTLGTQTAIQIERAIIPDAQ